MWKVTFFFQQWNSSWTETYYVSGSTGYSSVVSQCITIATTRVGMMGPESFLQAIRIVNLNVPRSSSFVAPGTFPTQGTFVFRPGTDPDQDSSPAFVSVQVKFFGTQGNICRRYFAGAPEGIVGTQFGFRNLQGNALWQNALYAFLTPLAVNSWSFRFTNQAGAVVCTQVLTNAQFPGEIGVQFSTQAVVPIAGKQVYIHLKGFRKVNYRQFGLGGNYAVDPLSPGLTASVPPYIYYLQNTPNVQVSNIAQRGTGVQLLYGYDGFSITAGPTATGFQILSANHRKRGGTALQLRGRSRSKP